MRNATLINGARAHTDDPLTRDLADALEAAEARATKAEREAESLRRARDEVSAISMANRERATKAEAERDQYANLCGAVVSATTTGVEGDIREHFVVAEVLRVVEERDRAREALATCKHADNADSLETELALVEAEVRDVDDLDAGDVQAWLQELRAVRIAARRCLGEEP